MKTIALISQKGGSGKTTLSLNLAIAATLKGKSVVIVDLDPQQSAARWARLRKDDNPVIVSGHGPNVADLVHRAKEGGADLVIIDTAPKCPFRRLRPADPTHRDHLVRLIATGVVWGLNVPVGCFG